LISLLDSPQKPVQAAAILALVAYTEPDITALVLSRWTRLSADVRNTVATAFARRPDRALELLQAVRGGTVAASDLSRAVVSLLRSSQNAAVAALADQVLPREPRPSDTLINLQPSLALSGDIARGHQLYKERCVSCHRSGSEGFSLGPDLVTVKSAGPERILFSIVDPNSEVAPQYIAFQIETVDGVNYTALIASETPNDVNLILPNGQAVSVLRTKVKSMSSSGQSLMPEGLCSGLSPQSVSDLLAFIVTAAPPASQ
jgi:putative heme-binding domain-containing protein